MTRDQWLHSLLKDNTISKALTWREARVYELVRYTRSLMAEV